MSHGPPSSPDNGDLPLDSKWAENRIRPSATGRQNWLLAGSLRISKRTAAIMNPVHSAKLNGVAPHADMRDVLERLPYHWRLHTSV